mgnify:CR=1 FL=1
MSSPRLEKKLWEVPGGLALNSSVGKAIKITTGTNQRDHDGKKAPVGKIKSSRTKNMVKKALPIFKIVSEPVNKAIPSRGPVKAMPNRRKN